VQSPFVSVSYSSQKVNGGIANKMKKLSVTEFKFFCERNAPMLFIFDTENQSGGEPMIKVAQRYNIMTHMLNPNCIMFANDQGTFCLYGVKYIELNEDNTVGYLFDVVCGSRRNDDENISYTFVADKIFV